MNEKNYNGSVEGIQTKVLVISDDLKSARIWSYVLQENQIDAVSLDSSQIAVQQWVDLIPDLIVIEMCSEDFNGIEIIRQIREQGVVPILMMTPIATEPHLLQAYQAGVDECVVRPVSPAIFLAKVRAWLRRSWSLPAESLDLLQVGGLRLDPTRRQVINERDEAIKLTNLEFRLLHLLMAHPGRVLTTEDIIMKVWGYHGNGDSILLKNVVYRLRRKIDPDQNNPRYIHTEAGIGYRFQDFLT